MAHLYVILFIGLCSFEAYSLEPLSPNVSPHTSPTKRSHRNTHVPRTSHAKRKLLFDEQEIKIAESTKREQERVTRILDTLNQLYQTDLSAYQSLKYFYSARIDTTNTIESRTKMFHDTIAYNAKQDSARKKYQKLFADLALVDEQGVIDSHVQQIYQNSVVTLLNPNDRVDEHRYGLSLPVNSPRDQYDTTTLTLAVPTNHNQPQSPSVLSLSEDQKAKYLRRVAEFKRKHPNKAKLIPALFDEAKFKEFKQNDSNANEAWRTFLKTLRHEKLTTKYFRPVTGFKYLIENGIETEESALAAESESEQSADASELSQQSKTHSHRSTSKSDSSASLKEALSDESSDECDDCDLQEDQIDSMVTRLKEFSTNNAAQTYKLLGLVDYDCYDAIMQVTTHDEWQSFMALAQAEGLLTEQGKPTPELLYIYDNGILGDGFANILKTPSGHLAQQDANDVPVVLSNVKLRKVTKQLEAYKKKHPNKYGMIPALFNPVFNQKVTATEEGKQAWRLAMKSFMHHGFISKDMSPSLELTYLYCKACNRK
jgi:hypothetical protein